MRSSLKFLLPSLAASVVIAACGSASSNSAASASHGAATSGVIVKTAAVSKLGQTVLVTSGGMTLYRLSGEHAGNFICVSSGCLAVWHPLTVSGSERATGVTGLGTIKRANGVVQVTYKGMPLYTFAQDRSPGQANGQGFKDVGTWNAVATGPAKYSAPVTSSSSSGATGY